MKQKRPENITEWLHLAGSYMWGQHLATWNSPINGKLEVWMINGRLMLNSANANQSYDSLHEVFSKVFEEIALDSQPVHHALLLGLGAGSVPAIIEEELMMNCMITAVERDPLMIELGRKYFDLERFKHLRIVQNDALHYVKHCTFTFELIIVDLFIDDHVPEPFTDELFLNDLCQLLVPEGFLLFNMIVRDPGQQEQFKDLYGYFAGKNGMTKVLQPIETNKVLYWQKG
jgi:spermidine synthase